MSEEEKRAIGHLEKMKEYRTIMCMDWSDGEILLKLINKLQKEIEHELNQRKYWRDKFYKQQEEIEELKSKYKDLFFQNFDLWEKSIFPKQTIEKDHISKDKIRKLIEELKKQDELSDLSHNYLIIPILQELLEEN